MENESPTSPGADTSVPPSRLAGIPLPVLSGDSPKRKSEPVDKGFCLSYYHLSYRRKLIRTLWMVPFALITLFLPVPRARFLFTVLLAGCLVQAGYNYLKWQSELKDEIKTRRRYRT